MENDHAGIRRALLRGGAALLGAVAAARVGAQARAKPEKSRVVLAVEGRTSFAYLPIVLADRLGYFAAEGLEVELVDVDGPLRASHAGPDGVADLLGGSFEHTIDWQLRGVFTRCIVLLGRAPQVAIGVSTRSLPNFRSLADLRGRRVGVVGSAPMAGLVINHVLLRGGMSAQDIKLVDLPHASAGVAAMRAGQVDALSATEPALTMLESRGEMRVVADTRTLKGSQEIFGAAMPAAALVAPQEFLQRYPQTVQAVVDATVHALKWLQTAGPSDLIKAVPDPYLHGDRGLYLASFNKLRETFAIDGLVADDGVRTAIRALSRVDAGFKADRVDPARTFTNEFARRAKAKFNA